LKELIFQLKGDLTEVKQQQEQLKERSLTAALQQLEEMKHTLQRERERITKLEDSYRQLIAEKTIELLVKQKVIEELNTTNQILLNQFKQFQQDINTQLETVENRINATIEEKFASIATQQTQKTSESTTLLDTSRLQQLEQTILTTIEKKFQTILSGPTAQTGRVSHSFTPSSRHSSLISRFRYFYYYYYIIILYITLKILFFSFIEM
jgi:DNA repair exonuclease SbcCD ATPase subunit